MSSPGTTDADESDSLPSTVSRRAFLFRAAVASGATVVSGTAIAQGRVEAPRMSGPVTPTRGLLAPQQNLHRNLLDLSGTWQFQLDPRGEGEAQEWFRKLPSPRPIAVPASWNDLFDDARNYFGLTWYLTETWLPPAWRGQRVFLRVGSANYAAQVWINGVAVVRHEGGHLPFVAELTDHIAWDRRNILAISVEDEQRPERVPHAPSEAGGLFSGVAVSFPATTFDFFPYSGLHRPVVLFTTPVVHIDDITVTTALEDKTGIVNVEVVTAGGRNFKGVFTRKRQPKMAAHYLRSRWLSQ